MAEKIPLKLKFRNTYPPARVLIACIFACFVYAIGGSGQTAGVYRGKEEKLPQTVPPQPLPFSHEKHVAAGMSCLDCHQGVANKERAGLPDTARCMLCHETIATDSADVQKLAKIHGEGGKLEWVRVYEVPDYVFFSHATHVNSGEECATCHGPVQQRAVLSKEVSTSMIACMNCHAAKEASIECYTCHDLGQ
jgi:hypothetical protein